MKIRPKTKKLSTPLPDWIDPIVARLREREGLKRLQGNSNASILMIAPRPGALELQQDLVWCDMAAVRFFNWMRNEFNLDSNGDFIIMPCTFDGKNPKKSNTDLGLELLENSKTENRIKRYIVIGSDAFKVYFGYGRKALMESLVGNTLYLQQGGYKPVFVFPDLWALNFDPEMRGLAKRDWARGRALCDYYLKYLERLEPAFRKFLKATKP